ncbi:MAG: glycosyltransferase family 1 protein [Muribaculaceae bacterium]
MKILFLGDASNYHITLAAALRNLGHEATVVSDGSRWMDTRRDIDLSREPGKVGAVKYVLRLMSLLPRMCGYDVVHLVNPVFLNLRPEKVRRVFDYVKRHNRSVFLSALGSDHDVVKACLEGNVLRYSEYMLGHTATRYMASSEAEAERKNSWLTPVMERHQRHVIDGIDGAVACLYEYYKIYSHIIPEKLAYGGIPIDTAELAPRFIEDEPQKVRLFIGLQRNRSIFKGTDVLLEAAQRVAARFPDKCELDVVENVPYAEYVERMRRSHVILDQLYSYTPATNALIAMAQGMVAVSGAEDEFYEFIGEQRCRPIVNVSPLIEGDAEQKLMWIVNNKAQLPALSRMSREFVEKHNDSAVVACRHIDFWNKTLAKKQQL